MSTSKINAIKKAMQKRQSIEFVDNMVCHNLNIEDKNNEPHIFVKPLQNTSNGDKTKCAFIPRCLSMREQHIDIDVIEKLYDAIDTLLDNNSICRKFCVERITTKGINEPMGRISGFMAQVDNIEQYYDVMIDAIALINRNMARYEFSQQSFGAMIKKIRTGTLCENKKENINE